MVLTAVIGWLLLWGKQEDYRVGMVGRDGIIMWTISAERRMINSLAVEAKKKVWIPGGLGWYQADKVAKILTEEKKRQVAMSVFFYNFGFIPEAVVFGEGDWPYRKEVVLNWGVVNWLKFWFEKTKYFIKEEILEETAEGADPMLDEMMPRDMADSRILREDLRLTVYNTGKSDGLAGFVARALERSGFTVVGVENYGGSEDGCQIRYGKGIEERFAFLEIRAIFDNGCRFEEEMSLRSDEMELYFGDKYAEMLNYQSYLE